MKRLSAMAVIAAASCTLAGSAFAQSAYLGEIRLFGFNFCPAGWLQAAGETLSIAQYTSLYSLYGTTYGGNGTTTFALPNLSGRAPTGAGAGLSVGQAYGSSTVALTVAQLPKFTPQLYGSSASASSNNPSGGLLGTSAPSQNIYAAGSSPLVPMSANAMGAIGGGQAITVQSPSLAMTWCVAATGLFPTRTQAAIQQRHRLIVPGRPGSRK